MSVTIRCPATSANLGPGFDALGVALALYNTFEVEEAEGFQVEASGPGAEGIPTGEENLTLKAFAATRSLLGLPQLSGLRVRVEIAVPPSRGLGSSATATVAGILAAEALSGESLDEGARVGLASRLEGHPDNTTPCLLGGLCVAIQGTGEIVYLRADPPEPPTFVVAIPETLELSTAAMRAVLPASVPFGEAVQTSGCAALLVFSLLSGAKGALPAALRDQLHEPYRGPKIPGFADVRAAAVASGALATVISGSGPTLLSFVADPSGAKAVGDAKIRAWEARGVPATAHVLPIDPSGARTL